MNRKVASLPLVFNSEKEKIPFLARMKKRASKDFRWTRWRSLQNATLVAYWLYIFGKDKDALEVCRFVAQYQFDGDHNFWAWVESALALQARLFHSQRKEQEATQCIERIRAAGFVEDRLKGIMIYGKKGYKEGIENAIADGDKILEREWRLAMIQELTVLIELGGSRKWPVSKLEKEFNDNLLRLQKLIQ
ncbi:MAG TPA: DUF6707 family protein [Candidatus Nitrosocosmicus sp.]|nr:DUF6707 family protein [Candidatus Nitrosocosmicus sp.]